MYDPKKVLTEDGYEDYLCHLRNIENGLFCIQNNMDDFHIGSKDGTQEDDVYTMLECWERLKKVLKKGDGEIDQDAIDLKKKIDEYKRKKDKL